MTGTIFVRNRQAVRRADIRRLRKMADILLRDLLQRARFDLGIYLVADSEMAQLNEAFLHHAGSTDVITFDYSNQTPAGSGPGSEHAGAEQLHGEIFICTNEAIRQAKTFHTTWQEEVVRYLIHGVLHLCGYDDRYAVARKRMKAKEERLLAELCARCNPRALQRKRT